MRVSHWTEPRRVDRGLELLSAGSLWQERGWREALRRLRDQLESDQPAAERDRRRRRQPVRDRHPLSLAI